MADQNRDELACVYAALVLLDDDVAITVSFIQFFSNFLILHVCNHLLSFNSKAEKIQTILKAADVKVEPYWPGLFAKALEGLNLKSMITNVGSGVGAAPAAAAAGKY